MPPKRKKTKKEELAAQVKKEKEEKAAVDEEEEDEDEEEEQEEDGKEKGRGKRERKSSLLTAFEPADFTMLGHFGGTGIRIVNGRGEALKTFPSVMASIEKASTEDVANAHRFLFGNRGGKLSKKQMISNLSEFSGYLEKKPKSYDKDKLESEEEAAETKYSKKAFKMLITEVKKMCHFFNVDIRPEDGKPLNKEDCIENLLDFLSQPNEDFLLPDGESQTTSKNAKKAAGKPRSKPAKSKTSEEVDMDHFSLVRAHKKGNKPTDKALRQWVQAYVVCFDMDSATTKHAIRTASDKFGVDLVGSKERIKELLAEEM